MERERAGDCLYRGLEKGNSIKKCEEVKGFLRG
jgi:hypothetical protein